MSSADEINVTLTNLRGMAESIVVSSTSTTLEELASLSAALGIADESSSSSAGNSAITFTVDGKVVYDAGSSASGGGGQKKLGEAGIKNGDMILVGTTSSAVRRGQAASAPAPAAAAASAGGGGGGGLDFSALLASAGAAPAPAAPAASSASASASASASGGGSAGLSFNIAGLEAMSASMGGMGAARAAPVEWPGMSLDDAMAQNPNPAQFVPLLLR